MFSDNENPARKFPPDKTATAATPAPETINPTGQTEENAPAAVKSQDTNVAALPLGSQPLSRFPLPNQLRRQTALRRWNIPT